MHRRQAFAPLDNYRYGHDNNIHLDICPKCLAPFEDENLFFEHISACEAEPIIDQDNYDENVEDNYDEEEEEYNEERPVIENNEVVGDVEQEPDNILEVVPQLEQIPEEIHNPIENFADIQNELNRLENLINNNINNQEFNRDIDNLRVILNRYLERNNLNLPALRRYNYNRPEEKHEDLIEQKHDYESYDCRLCLVRFSSRAFLENHFNLHHNNYADLMRLTEMSKPNFGFPGFELLKLIKMIEEVNILKLRDTECNICTNEFTYMTQEEKSLPTKTVCDLDIKPSKSNLSRFINCDLLLNNKYRNTIKFTHTYLKEYTEEIEMIKPFSMSCCEKIICNRCIKRQYSETGNLNCVYCKFDHTKYEDKYITVIEPHTFYDKKQWAIWWSNIVL